jgi:uncharacterized protein (DUF1330 family)
MKGRALQRPVIIAFPSLAAARDCYGSEACQLARRHRDAASIAHVVRVEGWPE